MVTDEELKKVYGMFTDAWKFYRKYADVQQSDEYWDAIVDESGKIAKKYDNAKLAIDLMLAAINELERKSKNIQKMQHKKSLPKQAPRMPISIIRLEGLKCQEVNTGMVQRQCNALVMQNTVLDGNGLKNYRTDAGPGYIPLKS